MLKSIESHFVGKHQRMIVRILEMTSKGWTTFQKAKMKDVVSHLEGKIRGRGGIMNAEAHRVSLRNLRSAG